MLEGYLRTRSGEGPCLHVYSGELVPENQVRRELKRGRALSVGMARDIYRRRSLEEYTQEHMEVVRAFCEAHESSGADYVTDGALLQAPLYELFGLYRLSPEEICAHLQRVVDLFGRSFSPMLVYIDTRHPALCVREALRAQALERRDWRRGFCRWLEVAPYPIEKGYRGDAGIERFCEERRGIDLYLYDHLRIKKTMRYRATR